ncbi:MAG TPA: hypothetical protein VKU01_16340 [Bryobacteraceae bacterium]|nr:hypothetical protein [Bryobacteraceae bacterium]
MKKPFEKQVFIRLTKNETGIVCTVKHGDVNWKVTEFTLEGDPAPADPAVHDEEAVRAIVRKRRPRQS